MQSKKKKMIIITAIITVSLVILGMLVWLFFPVILRAVNPTWYTQYAIAKTGRTLSSEITELNSFLNNTNYSEADVIHMELGLSDISISIDAIDSVTLKPDLSKLNLGLDLLYDKTGKQASLDILTGWDDRSFVVTLFTNVQQLALGFNDDISWVVNTGSIGKELAGLGLPVDDDFALDLSFLFPEDEEDGIPDEIQAITRDFFKSLRFKRGDSADNFIGSDGTVMTAVIDGKELHDFLGDMIYNYFGETELGSDLRYIIRNTYIYEHELTLIINKEHIIQAVNITVNVDSDSSVEIAAQLSGEKYLLDHILLGITWKNGDARNFYSIGIKGHNISIGLKQQEAFELTGNLTLMIGEATQNIRDITVGAYNIADFSVLEFSDVFLILWDIIRHDDALFELFGEQIIDLVLSSLFGDQMGSFIHDLLDGSTDSMLDIIQAFLSGQFDNVLNFFGGIGDVLGDIIGDGILDGLGDFFGDLFGDGALDDFLSSILGNIDMSAIDDLLENFGDMVTDFIDDTIADWLSQLFGTP